MPERSVMLGDLPHTRQDFYPTGLAASRSFSRTSRLEQKATTSGHDHGRFGRSGLCRWDLLRVL